MAYGFIYVLSNPSMPGLLKVGRTDRQPEERARELGTTGVPQPFKIEYSISVADTVIAETEIHRLLDLRGLRAHERREFFNADLEGVLDVIRLVTGGDDVERGLIPDFTLRSSLAELCASVKLPQYGEVIEDQKAESIEARLVSIGRRGYPCALKMVAELYERNNKQPLKFKEYWQEYLGLFRQEANFHPLSSGGGIVIRREVGAHTALYLDILAHHGWLTDSDFDFAQRVLVDVDQFCYAAYIESVQRREFCASIRERCLNL